jgi:hypothetical protein
MRGGDACQLVCTFKNKKTQFWKKTKNGRGLEYKTMLTLLDELEGMKFYLNSFEHNASILWCFKPSLNASKCAR